MRKLKYISPSALARWEDRREEFYKIHLSEVRTERSPQEVHMAAGSSFDAFVKSNIYSAVHGSAVGTQFAFDNIFESQVESHIRDEALEMGKFLFDRYAAFGAYANLLKDILDAPAAPQMEFTVEATVNGIPLMGKPDLRYVTREFVHVIADFKVNGSYSNHGVSPVQGYKLCLSEKKGSIVTETHKKYSPITYKDVEINANPLSEFSVDWATQLTMYAWCLGEEPGDEDYVVRMEQLACRPKAAGGINVKIATHMSQIPSAFQLSVMRRIMDCWECVQRDHIFTDLTPEQSREHCEMIDQKSQIPLGLHPVMNEYLTEKAPRFK